MSDVLENGMVALVGAGPGDPGLMTLRGVRLLEQADIVVYDYLAAPRLLAHAPAAEQLFVGKQASKHSMTQDQINALLIDKARNGHRVVRLKGGDPFIFGRGGEEAEALSQAGIRFVVVPGITAAIAGPAYAGIPVTHRDFNSSFTLITGHEKEEVYKDDESKARPAAKGSSDLDWNAISRLPCVAFYMGVKALPRIASKLISNGANPDTPAATIQWGTTARQRTCVATLGTIADEVKKAGISAPAITIVGRVVTMRDTLNWFETRPLYGKTVVVTRTREQASELSRKLESLGANVIEAATIELAPAADSAAFDNALRSLTSQERKRIETLEDIKSAQPGEPGHPARSESADAAFSPKDATCVVFTSANGVRATRDRMRTLKLDSRIFFGTTVAVIGEATARETRNLLHIEPDILPKRAMAEALAEELIARGQVAHTHYLLFRAEIARPVLTDRLTAAGAKSITDIAVYETKIAESLPEELTEALAGGRVDWVTFTSGNTARNFIALLGDAYAEKLDGVKLASIGPVTTQAIRDLKLEPTTIAAKADIDALVQAILQST